MTDPWHPRISPQSKAHNPSIEHRSVQRVKLPPMYTLVRVRPAGAARYCWTGHIYDISDSGMRFELDHSLEPGTAVQIRAMLPGATTTIIHASGRVVRLHDETEERGPMRMAISFDTCMPRNDRQKLQTYLDRAEVRKAA